MQIERDAFYAMLGIAMRLGQLSLGESGVLKAISSGAALFMILDAGASDNTKKFRDSCAFYQVPLYETTPDRLGSAIGKPGRMSAAIARGSLGGKLLALAKEEETGDAPSQEDNHDSDAICGVQGQNVQNEGSRRNKGTQPPGGEAAGRRNGSSYRSGEDARRAAQD